MIRFIFFVVLIAHWKSVSAQTQWNIREWNFFYFFIVKLTIKFMEPRKFVTMQVF